MLFTDLFTSLGMNHSLAWFISQAVPTPHPVHPCMVLM